MIGRKRYGDEGDGSGNTPTDDVPPEVAGLALELPPAPPGSAALVAAGIAGGELLVVGGSGAIVAEIAGVAVDAGVDARAGVPAGLSVSSALCT